MFLAYGQKICRAHLPAVLFQETGSILTHLMFFFFLGDLVFRPFSSILTFSACEICERVFLRQIFGPCATAGGLETFPTRGRCCGSFLWCGAARHGGPWVAPVMGMASNFQLAMAGQHHQQWLKEKVPESLSWQGMCCISPAFGSFWTFQSLRLHYLRGLFHHDMGIKLSLNHLWDVNYAAQMMCHLLFRKCWYPPPSNSGN